MPSGDHEGIKSLLTYQGEMEDYRGRLKRKDGNINLENEAHPVDIFGNKVVDLKGKLEITDKNRHAYF